jgi:hypothetical protein
MNATASFDDGSALYVHHLPPQESIRNIALCARSVAHTHKHTYARTHKHTHACTRTRCVLPGYDAYHISIDDRCTFAERNRRDRACGGKECAAVLPARSKAMTRVGAATPGVGPDARLRVSRVLRRLQAAHLSAVGGSQRTRRALRDTCSVRPDAGQVCLERFRASRHLAAQGAHHFLRAFEQESAPVGALQADRSAALRIST